MIPAKPMRFSVIITILLFNDVMAAQMKSSVLDYIPKSSLPKRFIKKHLSRHTEGIEYLSHSYTVIPIIPFQIFAVTYIKDIVIETNHPKISMHEFAQIKVNNETIWIAKDSTKDGVQTLTLPDEKFLYLFPEVNVPRRVAKISVIDDSTKNDLSLKINYKNQFNEMQEITFHSPQITQKHQEKKSNSSTFNHSIKTVSALLDLSHKVTNKINATVTYDGINFGLRKIFNIFPVKAVLRQTQAGFSSGIFTQKFSPKKIEIIRSKMPTEVWDFHNHQLKQKTQEREIVHQFNDKNELLNSRIESQGKTRFSLQLSAPLPDLTRSFNHITRNFVIFINQKAQGAGKITVKCNKESCELALTPSKPRWFKKRPLFIKINKSDRKYQTDIKILP